jgi:hypothetical protein
LVESIDTRGAVQARVGSTFVDFVGASRAGIASHATCNKTKERSKENKNKISEMITEIESNNTFRKQHQRHKRREKRE